MDRHGIDDIAHALGVRLRRARLARGLTQREVAAVCGISQSVVSRMELGNGASTPLGSWVSAAMAVGMDLLAKPGPGTAFGRDAVLDCARDGGWTVVSIDGAVVTLDRVPRRVPGLVRERLVAGERLAVLLVDVLTDVDAMVEASRAAERVARRDLPAGWSVGRLVVIRQTTANRRRMTESYQASVRAYPDSGSLWIGALRGPEATMPNRPGLVWVDRHGTRLIPTGLRLRRG